jgi:hypothetical protein
VTGSKGVPAVDELIEIDNERHPSSKQQYTFFVLRIKLEVSAVPVSV